MTTVLVVIGGVLALIAAGALAARRAEAWATTVGLARAHAQLVAALGTDDVDLEVPARPLLPVLLRSPGTAASLRAGTVPIADGAGHVRILDATVTDVRVQLRTRRLTTADGRFRAVIDQDDLSRMVRLPGVVARLELRHHGLRVWTVLGVPVDTRTELRDGELRVFPDPLQVRDLLRLPGLGAFRRTLEVGGMRIELPQLPLGATIEQVDFGAGQVTATGRFSGLDLTLRP